MNRRIFMTAALASGAGWAIGCRSNQFARIMRPGEKEMVGSHAAGAETFKPLVEEAVGSLLARHASGAVPIRQVSTGPEMIPPGTKRICFIAVENKSAEEIGDFKDQLYQCIDTKILQSGVFQPVSKRFVDAGLMETRLRPDQLLVPDPRRAFVAVMEQQGQPFDYLLYATITSGTTRANQDYQRDYLLTLEMVNIHNGEYDKQSATISKGYHHSRISRLIGAAK